MNNYKKYIPKYKVNDYVIVQGACTPEVHGTTVRIADIIDDCYFIDQLNDDVYVPWRCVIADANTVLDKTRMVLYGQREET